MKRLLDKCRDILTGTVCTIQTQIESLGLLAQAVPAIRDSHVVIIMHERCGFGHTIHGPDATRRLFRNKKPLFIVFEKTGELNPYTAELWPDIRVIFLPVRTLAPVKNTPQPLPLAAMRIRAGLALTRTFCRIFGPDDQTVLSMTDMYAMMEPDGVAASLPDHLQPPQSSMAYFCGYPDLITSAPAVPPRLPAHLRTVIENALAHRFPDGVGRTCNLYLRFEQQNNLTSERRNGSSLEDYTGAIAMLVENGYTVLLTGDRPLEQEHSFPDRMVDAASLGVDKRIFDLYAATECDCFIGENGAGMFLPNISRKPGLLVNAFPFSYGMSGWWHVHKVAKNDSTGDLLPMTELFRERGYDYAMKGATVTCAPPDMITKAVAHFLNTLDADIDEQWSNEFVASMPDHNILKRANGRISPAWLEQYGDRTHGNTTEK